MVKTFGFVIPYVLIHIIWVGILDYRNPMPFVGQTCTVTSMFTEAVTIWFLFPEELRKSNHPFRKQIVAYMMRYPVGIIIGLEYPTVAGSTRTFCFFLTPTSIYAMNFRLRSRVNGNHVDKS